MQLIIRDPEYGDLRCMECEVPEVVVFLKENGFQIIKDMCMDGEVPSHDKCCVQNCELDHNNISNLLKYELAENTGEFSEEVLLYISSRAEESFSNRYCIHDHFKLCDAEEKLMDDKTVASETADISTQDCSSKKELSDGWINPDTGEHITMPSLSQLFNRDDLRDQQQNHQEDPNTQAIIADSWCGKEADCRNCNGGDLKSEVDLGAERITDDSGSQTVTDDKAKTTKSAVEQTPEAESRSETADYMSKLPLLSSSSSRQDTVGHHRELGSSSFSAASTPSGRLTFSGLIPFSDNISLRSSSTASTRSFAFPILAAEWNESPIRMAEVDRRPKRFGCWRMCCFTCSKF